MPAVPRRQSSNRSPSPRTPKVGFVSLGCPKALVDSERILTQLRVEGYQIVPTYRDADLVVVNTCGFIDTAIQESLEAIGEAVAENGKVIVTGCLGATKADEIRKRHPEVLKVTGPQRYEEVLAGVHEHLPPAHDPFMDLVPPQGIRLTPRHYAYLKISEGCNHKCSFCIIPSMRGKLDSRPIGEVMREAEQLVKAGVKELLVISQDTSAYGADLKYRSDRWREREWRTHLRELCEALGTLGIWVRLHYVYPYPHVDEIIPLMSDNGVLPYLDIPFQHASPRILKLMKRPAHAENTLARIQRWRELQPELSLRSTFIVGFPGETEQDFEQLLDWLRQARLDRVGCFKYSPVDGAAANLLPDPVPEEAKQERWERFMQVQAEISAARLQRKLGQTLTVLVDSVTDGKAIARSSADAPDIDGVVHIHSAGKLRAGEFAQVKIERADAYDLHARLIA
ncbi:MAG: 30S ribosomal protein S12 methylthiotransferase RimO [Nevskiales bacterium]